MRQNIYPPSRPRTLASVGIFMVLGALAIWRTKAVTIPFQDVTLWIIGFFSLSIGLVLFVNSFTRIITTPQGLEYRSTGFHITTAWDNIERISTLPVDAFVHDPAIQEEMEKRTPASAYRKSMEVLILRQPVPYTRSWWMPALSDEVRFVPLAEFRDWRNGELGQVLREHAPHIFT